VLRNEPGRAAKRNRSDQATLGLRPTSAFGGNAEVVFQGREDRF
jgi:hypothetical protein